MKTKSHKQNITITITDEISLSKREASFIMEMAKWCTTTLMPGSAACKRLVKVLTEAGIPDYDGNPVYGIFERPED